MLMAVVTVVDVTWIVMTLIVMTVDGVIVIGMPRVAIGGCVRIRIDRRHRNHLGQSCLVTSMIGIPRPVVKPNAQPGPSLARAACAILHISSIGPDARSSYTGIVLIKEVAMDSFETAVKKTDVSSATLRRLGGFALGVLAIGVTFAGQASAQGAPPSHARPHAVNNQPGVNAKHAKPAPAAGAARFSPPAPMRAQAPMRAHAPMRDDGPGRNYTPERYQAPAGHREPARYHAPARYDRAPQAAYRFRDADRGYLQRHYRSSLRTVRIDRRPMFSPGRIIPVAYRSHVAVLPAHVHRHLPPPPRGYRVGYYEGYSVVYDPVTFTILSVLDLLSH